MAFNENLADRIRVTLASLAGTRKVEEKLMFGGICFMVNGKMCAGVIRDDMMCRIDPAREPEALERPGCRPMDFTSRPMKGYIYVEEPATRRKPELAYWLNLCLDYNNRVKPSKKSSRPKR